MGNWINGFALKRRAASTMSIRETDHATPPTIDWECRIFRACSEQSVHTSVIIRTASTQCATYSCESSIDRHTHTHTHVTADDRIAMSSLAASAAAVVVVIGVVVVNRQSVSRQSTVISYTHAAHDCFHSHICMFAYSANCARTRAPMSRTLLNECVRAHDANAEKIKLTKQNT